MEYRPSDPLRIKSVEFMGAIGQIGQAPPETAVGVPQVAVAGRSNVGKSSLINRLLGRTRTQLARVSQQPGKTQEINFYRVRTDLGDFYLVDLPGYGYAKAPEALRERWRPLIHGFLSTSPDLRGVLQLIDIRSGPTDEDLQSVDYLSQLGIPAFFALTKTDQLKPSQVPETVARTARALGVESDQVLGWSSLKGTGREGLLAVLRDLLFSEDADDDDGTEPSGEEGEPAAGAGSTEAEASVRSD